MPDQAVPAEVRPNPDARLRSPDGTIGGTIDAVDAVTNPGTSAPTDAVTSAPTSAVANAGTDPALEPATAEIPVTQPPAETASAGEPKPPVSPVRRLAQLVRANLPFLLVLLVAAAAFLRIVQNHWRQGSTLLGCALLLAALLRALLPDDQTGLIVVRRSRLVDVLSYAALGACMVFVSLTIEGGPFDR